MIQPSTPSNISGTATSQAFTIEANESMFALLTSRVYNDTILAPIREWSTNALDSCIEADVTPRFDVHLPTFEEPHFSVRDYGTGLSPEDMLGLFCTFGASTKRTSNKLNGTFGLGRMSGLAYASSFTVESFINNTHHSYLITIANGIPSAVDLGSVPTSQPTGLRLTLSTKTDDIPTFRKRASELYRYFDVKPSLNVELDVATPEYLVTGSCWAVDSTSSYNYVRMSNIRYKLENSDRIDFHGLHSLLIDLPNGAINYNPGRESLSLDEHTITYLSELFSDIASEYTDSLSTSVTNATSPRLQLEAYSLALKVAPSAIRSDIAQPALQYVRSYTLPTWNRNGTTISTSLAHTNIRIKHRNYTMLRNENLLLSEFTSLPFIICDQKTSFISAIKQICELHPNTSCYVLSAESNKNFDLFLAESKAFTTYFDATSVYYTSDYSEEKISTAEGRSLVTPYVSEFASYKAGFLKSEISDPSNTYYYIPLSGTSSDLTDSKLTALSRALSLFSLPLHGVPKKYLSAAEASPNFIPAEDHLLTLLPTVTYTAYSGYSELSPICRVKVPNPPPIIDQVYRDRHSYTNRKSSPHEHNPETLTLIAHHYPIQYTIISPTYSAGEIEARYPLLPLLMGMYSAGAENYQHYYNLEELRHAQHNPPT